MKTVLAIIMLTLSFAACAKEIQIADSGITFDAPDEFVPLPQEIIDFKWPNKRAPKWAIGNASGATTIAYDIKPANISDARLPDLMNAFKLTFDRAIPGIQWIKREIIELSGKKWIYLEATSSAIDTDIHNILLATSYGSKMLIFNFNSTKKEFPQYESKLRNSIQTIKLPGTGM